MDRILADQIEWRPGNQITESARGWQSSPSQSRHRRLFLTSADLESEDGASRRSSFASAVALRLGGNGETQLEIQVNSSPPDCSQLRNLTINASDATAPSQQTNFHPTYRSDIDGLRAVAVLAVVVFHAFPSALPGGFVGVDVFFVISGFLISGIILKSLQRGDFSFSDFYARRVRRIFPALALVLAACYAIGWFALLPEEFQQLGKHIAAGAGFAQNFILWKEAGYFDTASELKPLVHLWSLAVEEQFYLIYPLLLWLGWRMRCNLFAVIGGLALWSFLLNLAGINKDAVGTFFFPQTRFWELFAGGILAYLYFVKGDDQQRRVPSDVAATGGLVLLAVSLWLLDRSRSFPGWWGLLPVGGTCLLIYAGPQAWFNRIVLANRLLVFLGLVSYPLYLWHWPLLSFARIVESGPPAVSMRIAILGVSLLLACLTYRLLERPIRFGQRSAMRTAGLSLTVLFLGLSGWNVLRNGGLDFRMRQFRELQASFAWGDKSNTDCRQVSPSFGSQEYCLVAKSGAPTVLLAGDSHANSLYPGLAESLRNTDENVLNVGGGGCLPFYNLASFQRGAPDRCRQITEMAVGFGDRTASVKTVVLAGRWPLYLSGVGYGEETGYDWVLRLNDDPKGAHAADAFRLSMEQTLASLLANGKHVVFVLDIPELSFRPQACVGTRPLRLSSQVRTPCVELYVNFENRQKAYRNLVRGVLSKFPAVKVFDPALELCDDTNCWAMRDGRVLYRDDNHLSMEGSRRIGRQLAQTILAESIGK